MYCVFVNSTWQVTQTLIFGYLSDYIRCASNVLLVKCLRMYPNNNWFKKELVGQNRNKWIYPTLNELSSYSPAWPYAHFCFGRRSERLSRRLVVIKMMGHGVKTVDIWQTRAHLLLLSWGLEIPEILSSRDIKRWESCDVGVRVEIRRKHCRQK